MEEAEKGEFGKEDCLPFILLFHNYPFSKKNKVSFVDCF